MKAAIDVGTNTVRLLVRDGAGRQVARDVTITRLGEGVDQARALQPEPLRRTVEAIQRYARQAREAGAARLRIAATSAVRDAANAADFLDAVASAAGVTPEVLTGEQEAALSFAGAASSMPGDRFKVVVDIGGGSTEMIAGDTAVRAAISVDVGSVRLTERHVHSDPPNGRDLVAVRADASLALRHAHQTIAHVIPETFTMVSVAGTATTLGALSLGLDRYDAAKVHHCTLTRERLAYLSEELARTPLAERRRNPVITPGRADVIVAGALILEEAMDVLGAAEALISEADILDGLLASGS